MSLHQNISFVNRRIHKVDKHQEIHRFDRNTFGMAIQAVELGDEWASSPIISTPNITVIHYTPHYLYAPTVPFEVKRFYAHSDELKLVVMLREPVKRAWSSYWFHNSHLIQGEDKGVFIIAIIIVMCPLYFSFNLSLFRICGRVSSFSERRNKAEVRILSADCQFYLYYIIIDT
jgi:hypothetical protein